MYTKLPLSESSRDNCTMTATKGIGFGLVFKGTRGKGREEGTTDKLTKVRPTW